MTVVSRGIVVDEERKEKESVGRSKRKRSSGVEEVEFEVCSGGQITRTNSGESTT